MCPQTRHCDPVPFHPAFFTRAFLSRRLLFSVDCLCASGVVCVPVPRWNHDFNSRALTPTRLRCPQEGCTFGFSQTTHLAVHMRSHTGERPFRWHPICTRFPLRFHMQLPLVLLLACIFRWEISTSVRLTVARAGAQLRCGGLRVHGRAGVVRDPPQEADAQPRKGRRCYCRHLCNVVCRPCRSRRRNPHGRRGTCWARG